MKIAVHLTVVAAGLLAAQVALAQAPAGSTGICKDGSYTTAASKQGACRGHQGVKEWYSGSAAGSSATASAASGKATPAKGATAATQEKKASAAAPAATPAPAAAATPATAAAPPTNNAAAKSATARSSSAPAAGGGPGMVWVNTSTKVYHCPGSQFYGKTKDGSYMSEADAKAKGARPDHNKPCGK